MCGRDTFFATWAEVRAFCEPLKVATPEVDPAPTWNRPPTADGFAIVPAGAAAALGLDAAAHPGLAADADALAWPMRWGLVPAWSNEPASRLATHNARIESVATKPMFRTAFAKRHCLVPSSGYYEWRDEGGVKQPWFIHAPGGGLLMFAGIWERWNGSDGSVLDSYCVLTEDAEGSMATLHDRRPITLPPALFGDWLSAPGSASMDMLHANPGVPLEWHPVRRNVGSAQVDQRLNIEPIELASLPLGEVHSQPGRASG